MRTIRLICLTALVLIGLCGVAAYFATTGITDKHTSSVMLFALAWTFSGLGVTTAACLIGYHLNTSSFGSRKFIGELFESYFQTALVACLISCIIAFFGSWYDGGNQFDWDRALVFTLGAASGLVVGFFGILLVNGRESWTGNPEVRRPTRLRKVS